jgi:hypothetical protein
VGGRKVAFLVYLTVIDVADREQTPFVLDHEAAAR